MRGYESDIADGMRWAVGITVPAVPANPDIADLAERESPAPGSCSSALQSAINEVLAAGAPIVVAAGNNTLSASGFSPGNCTGVITVGAVDRNGGKASYTNFGSAVSLSAPGGKAISDFISGDTVDNQWVLSTTNPGTTNPSGNNAYYAPVYGTSISTAQVTGIASLMLSVNPSLSPQFVKEILQNTSRPFPINTPALGSQADCTTALCGSGIAESKVAVGAAQAMSSIAPIVEGGGLNNSFGLRTDGTLFAWGAPNNLGVGAVGAALTPIVVSTLSGITRYSAGEVFSLAVRPEGSVLAWGHNGSGQLGDGTTIDRPLPVLIPGLSGVIEVAAAPSNVSTLLLACAQGRRHGVGLGKQQRRQSRRRHHHEPPFARAGGGAGQRDRDLGGSPKPCVEE